MEQAKRKITIVTRTTWNEMWGPHFQPRCVEDTEFLSEYIVALVEGDEAERLTMEAPRLTKSGKCYYMDRAKAVELSTVDEVIDNDSLYAVQYR